MRLLVAAALLAASSAPLHAVDKQPAPQSALPSLTLDALSATREHPLFLPSRTRATPPAAQVANPQAPAQSKPRYSLRGIIVSGAETLVLLSDNATSEVLTLHPGDSIGRWSVVVDSNYSAKLKNGSDEVKLEMFAQP
jgi:general secretion pathway protein N